jgi:hypothetical protein
MKILLDTSVYPGLEEKLMGKLLAQGITPVVTDYIIEELRENIKEHYTERERAIALDLFLELLALGVLEIKTLEDYIDNLDEASRYVPDKDAPILSAVMLPDIDLFITKDEKTLHQEPETPEHTVAEKDQASQRLSCRSFLSFTR